MTVATLLHRQIHPSWIQNNFISEQAFLTENDIASLAFTPSEKDHKKLSVYNGEKFSAQDSFNHYTQNYSSAGVLSVTFAEVSAIKNLNAYEDNMPFDGHAVIDYSNIETPSQIRKSAKKLKNIAVKRGWTHKI
ncbi:hypothetical protein [Flavobacterium sp.]|uniref:hypothetical protein n=1 Tax=Flavobacterium sp. TaxID=239 RepID=UPI00262038F9|nr:hypothetical protein [Flavobacterium sp.]